MRIWTRSVRVLAIAAAMSMAAPLAGVTCGEVPAGGPVIVPVIDGATQSKASEVGAALLAKAKWSTPLAHLPGELAAVGQTLLVYGFLDKPIPLNVQTGHIAWTPKTNSRWADVVPSAVAVSDGGLEVVHPSVGRTLLTHMAKDTGEESTRWQVSFPPTGPRPDTEIMYKATIAGEQVIVDGNNVTPMSNGGGSPWRNGPIPMSIRSLDRKTGTQQWATAIDGGATHTSQPLVAAGKVYVVVDQSVPLSDSDFQKGIKNPKSYLLALNAKDGKVAWRTPTIEAGYLSPVIAGQLLLTGTQKDVVAYDAQTGKERWRVPVSTYVAGDITPLETQLFVDQEQLLVVVRLPNDATPARGNANEQRTLIVGAFAMVDLQTGKQTGYFGGFSRQLPRRLSLNRPLEILGIHRDTIFAYERGPISGGTLMGGWCLGINRKTLQVECFIPHVESATLSNDVLYLGAIPVENENYPAAPGTIYAVPLAAWDEVTKQQGLP